MPRPPKPFIDTLAEHRRRLSRIVDRRAAKPMARMYDQAINTLTARLSAIASPRETFTAHQHRIMLVQLRQGKAVISRRMAGELGDISKQAQTEALRGVGEDISRLEHYFTGADVVLPIDEAARFQGIINGRRDSLLRAHWESMSHWTADGVREMENELSMSLMTGEDFGTAVERVDKVGREQWWQAERIVRTETAYAFNATHADGMAACAEELPDLWMRWSEHVDDMTFQPLDDRVSGDSIIMHGQLAKPGGVFYFPTTMPDGGPIPPEVMKRVKHLSGKSWGSPPNRPNDRSVLAPWRPHWGIPGWRWEGGRRVEAEQD
jgi:hypothetical protein